MEEAKQYVRKDEHGTYRVGNTRILLDLVIGSYDRGYSPEFIRQQYPSLDLEQIYGAITWYLAHVEEMKSYMAEARGHADPV